MKIAVVGGAGKMALGAILDFVENKNVEKIRLIDINEEALAKRKKELDCDKINTVSVDITDTEKLGKELAEYDAVLNASSHIFNTAVMDACLIGKTAYTDFGGLYHWALEQLKYHDDFKAAGITGIVGSGSAPGMVNVMAKYAVDRLDTVETVAIYDGIANFNDPGFRFVPPYSLNTILDEYSRNNYCFRDGKHVELKPFQEIADFDFGYNLGVLPVYDVIHSEVATMPISFAEKGIKNVCFKLSLPVKFEERLRFMLGIGMGKTDPINVNGADVIPRDFTCALIDKHLKETEPAVPEKPNDHKVLKVIVDGEKDGIKQTYSIESVMGPYEKWNMTMGAFTVGFPGAVTTRMLADGRIGEPGFFSSEQVVDPEEYFKELAARDIFMDAIVKTRI